jgi:hypothetical protein
MIAPAEAGHGASKASGVGSPAGCTTPRHDPDTAAAQRSADIGARLYSSSIVVPLPIVLVVNSWPKPNARMAPMARVTPAGVAVADKR